MVRVPGSWKSLRDLEEHVTMPELEAMLTAAREIDYQNRKFQAAMKGVDLDASTKSSSTFEEIEQRARAKAMGMDEDEMALTELGFQVTSEDDIE